MKEPSPTVAAMGRAGRRATYHLLQAVVEGLKAVEAVIDELGGIGDAERQDDRNEVKQKIEVE
jgi:hypothetical protein